MFLSLLLACIEDPSKDSSLEDSAPPTDTSTDSAETGAAPCTGIPAGETVVIETSLFWPGSTVDSELIFNFQDALDEYNTLGAPLTQPLQLQVSGLFVGPATAYTQHSTTLTFYVTDDTVLLDDTTADGIVFIPSTFAASADRDISTVLLRVYTELGLELAPGTLDADFAVTAAQMDSAYCYALALGLSFVE